MSNKERSINEETPILEILTQIKNGIRDPKNLPTDIRRDCVEHLWHVEGQSTAVIAQILKVSDKTIQRNKDIIRERNAKKLTSEDRLKILGELLAKGTAAHENLMRLARSKEGSLQERSQSAYYACKILEEGIKSYQSLGYFPSKPMQIEADVHYSHEEEMSPVQLKEELARLEGIVNTKGIVDPKIAKLIETVKGQIALAEAKLGIKELKTWIDESDKGKATS